MAFDPARWLCRVLLVAVPLDACAQQGWVAAVSAHPLPVTLLLGLTLGAALLLAARLAHARRQRASTPADAGQGRAPTINSQGAGASPRAAPAGGGSDALLSTTFMHMREGVVAVDPASGELLVFNDAACAALGHTRDAFARLTLADLDADPTRPTLCDRVAALAAGDGGSFERRLWHRDGSAHTFEVRAQVLAQDGRAALALIWTDRSDRIDLARRLRACETRQRELFDGAPVGLASLSTDGRFIAPNARLCQMLGRAPQELEASALQAVTHRADRDLDRRQRRRLLAGEIESYSVEQRLVRRDGRSFWALATLAAAGAAGEVSMLRLVVQELPDDTASGGREGRGRRFRDLLDALPDAVLLLSPPVPSLAGDGLDEPEPRVIVANAAAAAALRRERAALADATLDELLPGIETSVLGDILRRVARGGRPEQCPPLRLELGEPAGGDGAAAQPAGMLWLEPLVTRTAAGDLALVLGEPGKRQALDVALSESRAELELMAYYDPLTRLPNLRLFLERVRQACAAADSGGRALALCCLDLDGFEAVNAHHGRDTGDALLRAVAERLESHLAAGDTVGRWAGDEFVLLLTDLDGLEGCDERVLRLQRLVAEPFQLGARTVQVTASVGVAFWPWDRAEPNDLLRHARHAMHLAKSAATGDARGGCHYFDAEADGLIGAHRRSLARIEDSLLNDALCLRYLPIVDLRHGRVAGMEALVSWEDPGRGRSPLRALLPRGAAGHLVRRLDLWTLDHGLPDLGGWLEQGLELRLHLGLSATTLLSDGFHEVLQMLLDAYPLVPPSRLLLGLRDAGGVEDLGPLRDALVRAGSLGVGFALDDFGAGQGSLAQSRALPVALLKLAPELVQDLPDGDARHLVLAATGVANAFNRQTLAAGVALPEQAIALNRLGCALVQGPAVGAELSAAQVPDWVRAWAPEPRWLDAEYSDTEVRG